MMPLCASAVIRPFQTLPKGASAEARSCCDCAPPDHQMMSDLIVSSFLKARSRSSG